MSKIYSEIKYENSKGGNHDFNSLLSHAIDLWFDEIGLGKSDIIKNNILYEEAQNFSLKIYNEWRSQTARVLTVFKTETNAPYVEEKSPLNRILSGLLATRIYPMNGIMLIVLIALLIVAVSIVIYSIDNQKRVPLVLNNESDQPSQIPLEKLAEKILVLVINSQKKNCLDKIMSQSGEIKSEDCKELYRATSFLWMGNEQNQLARFRNFENLDNYVANEESEYDVYLIKIILPKMSIGFLENADQLDRLDAFQLLAGCTADISRRLKVSVYENTNVYSR
jgi:hypothetical protein